MAETQLADSVEALFKPGPAFADGPAFGQDLYAFLESIGSSSSRDFAGFWLKAAEGDQLPTWASLQPHKQPRLILSSFLLERPEATDKMIVRFIGNTVVDSLGADVTRMDLGDIDQGETFQRWKASVMYCLDNRAIASVDYDLGFSGRYFKKATAVLFPLRTESDYDQLVGFTLWRD